MGNEHAGQGPVERRVRPLREGEVMAVYIDFDRYADKTLPPAEYLLRFGAAVSEATVKANCQETLSQRMRKAGYTRRPSAKSLPSDE